MFLPFCVDASMSIGDVSGVESESEYAPTANSSAADVFDTYSE